MEIFEFILILLGMVFISNVLSRFLPSISIPLIQIGLGILIVLPFEKFNFSINPELFMLLFLAPLLFNDGKNTDKVALWKWRKPIFWLSICLVFITVYALGMLIGGMITSLPVAAAFALAAALAPTDAVAVSSLAEKVKIPKKAIHILEGESLINDASGLVSFQFAVLALTTGTFSLLDAGMKFVLISIGGIALGVVLSLIKWVVTTALRRFGIENIISFLLLDLLTPFLIFLIAESLEVNGILAVVSAGMMQSIGYSKMNPESARLNTLSKNTWSVLTFSLNGVVFILLGTQLPRVVSDVWFDTGISNSGLVFLVLCITAGLLVLRFLLLFIFRAFSEEKKSFKERTRDSFLYTISGVRGTVTLVSALSLPFVIQNGETFASRNLLIALAAGVILTTLLLANFVLPLFAEKKQSDSEQNEVVISILRDVMKDLKKQENGENKDYVHFLSQIYQQRILELNQDKEHLRNDDLKMKITVLNWEIEKAASMKKKGEVSDNSIGRFINKRNKYLYILTNDKKYRNRRRALMTELRAPQVNLKQRKKERWTLQEETRKYVTQKLETLPHGFVSPEMYDIYLTRYEGRGFTHLGGRNKQNMKEEIEILAEYAIQVERALIQKYFEKGELSRKDMKKCREEVLIMENDLFS
ncbi:Na+/H+ antiporter [Listeria sp. PSOL-1]|uniref:Na+/H+ antiporter n=1 Tax=Listeria sp. PSOL-1 TaxID=1844999 RepID=UPI0013D09515|nr:Na+/H+ antiporter [Listeria sp. PSOL-1]